MVANVLSHTVPYDRELVAEGIADAMTALVDPPHFADVRATSSGSLAHPLARAMAYGCVAMVARQGVTYLVRADGSCVATLVTASERRFWKGMQRMLVFQDAAPGCLPVIDVNVGYRWCTATVVDAHAQPLASAPSLAGWCRDGARRPNGYVRPTVEAKRRRARDVWELVDAVGTRQAVMSIHSRAVLLERRWWTTRQSVSLVSFRQDLDLVDRLTAFASVWARHAQRVREAERSDY